VGTDPIAERLRPGRLDVGEVRGAHHRDEDLRSAHLAGQPIDDHRHGVTGVIDEQLVATDVGLAHRERGIVDVIMHAGKESAFTFEQPISLVFAVHKEFSEERIRRYHI
jgi:hypothetical protein